MEGRQGEPPKRETWSEVKRRAQALSEQQTDAIVSSLKERCAQIRPAGDAPGDSIAREQVAQRIRAFEDAHSHSGVVGVVLKLAAAGMLLLGAVRPLPRGDLDGWYSLLCLVLCGAALFAAVELPPARRGWAWLVVGMVAVLFNPVVPLHFVWAAWPFIHVGGALLLLVSIFTVDRRSKSAAKKKAMTLSEAEYVSDIVTAELLRPGHHPVSALKGYDPLQICTAFNLLIANEFLLLKWTADAMLHTKEKYDFEKEFAEMVRLYGGFPGTVMFSFVRDDQADAFPPKRAFDRDDPTFLCQETPSSFAQYCRSLGADDPLYWQKVYTRLGLEYTSTAPRGNEYVSTSPTSNG